MPSPSTSVLPRPKSWDEFEDIVSDVLARDFQCPLLTRHGRLGQTQSGVDISGRPRFLQGGLIGVQCKHTDKIGAKMLRTEVRKAKDFRPKLALYLMVTSASRDAALQRCAREIVQPFPAEILFWEDLCLKLAGHRDLLEKHFPGWVTPARPNVREIVELLLNSEPESFVQPREGSFVHKDDTQFQIQLPEDDESERRFREPWVEKFPDPSASRQEIEIRYGSTLIHRYQFIYVDGARHLLPMPLSRSELVIDRFQYRLAQIVNQRGYPDLDEAIRRAGMRVVPRHAATWEEVPDPSSADHDTERALRSG